MLGTSVLRYPAALPAAHILNAAALELLGVVIMGWGAVCVFVCACVFVCLCVCVCVCVCVWFCCVFVFNQTAETLREA